jgi:L-iditol 2-dehydrogenase
MKVAKLYSFDDIRIEDMPVPDVGPFDALVRVKACGICSGDVMRWYIEKKAPLVLGHEAVGEIVRLGERVQSSEFRVRKENKDGLTQNSKLKTQNFKAGDRVFFHHHAPCFNCRYCKRGDYVQCSTWRESKIIPGGISEYVLVPEENLSGDTLLLPETVTFEAATLIEPVACVVKGLRRSGLRKGDTVLVIGLGVMGQIHVILAKYYGASKVIGADRVPYRLEKAKSFGADEIVNVSQSSIEETLQYITKGEMADIVVVGPGSIEAMTEGIRCAGRGGRVLFFTPVPPEDILQLQPNEIYFKDINIITSYSCGPDDTREALSFISNKVINAGGLITHRFPIEETSEAFRLTAEAKESLKVVVTI